MSEELQKLIFKYSLLHVLKNFSECQEMFIHSGIRIKPAIRAKANWHFKLCHILQIDKNAFEFLLRIKK